MKRIGTVVIEDGKRYVEYDKHEQCAGCGACNASRKYVLRDELEAGTRVEVELSDNMMVPAAAASYIFPLIGLVVGLMVGIFVGGKFFDGKAELIGAICGIVFSAACYGILRLFDGRICRAFRTHVVRVAENEVFIKEGE